MRRRSIITVGSGEAEIKIYTLHRNDGYPSLQCAWYELGRRKTKTFASAGAAKLFAQQVLSSCRHELPSADPATQRDFELMRACEARAKRFGLNMVSAFEEWSDAKLAMKGGSILDAVRFFNANHAGLPNNLFKDVADECFAAKEAAWISHAYRRSLRRYLARMKDHFSSQPIADEYLAARRASGVTENYLDSIRRYLREFGRYTAGRVLPDLRARDVDDFLQAQTAWGPRSKNDARQKLITFGNWSKGRGFLPRDWREFDGAVSYLEPVMDVTIYTSEEMERLLNAGGKHLATPFVAIGAFASLRSAEIQRLDWRNIHLDRGFIEVRADICKTRSRRLVPINENLRAWLQPFAMPSGRVVMHHSISEALKKIAARVGLTLKRNALRHSFVSYRLAQTSDPARTALEAGHDQTILFQYYREVVTPELAAQWFAIMPPIEMERGLVGICRGTIGKPQRKGITTGESRAETTICTV